MLFGIEHRRFAWLAIVMVAVAPASARADTTHGGNGTGDHIATSSGAASGKGGSAASKSSIDGAGVADPGQLIDPNLSAQAIAVRETPKFASIKIVPVEQSGNSKPLVQAVMDENAAAETLRDAIRANADLMRYLRAHDVQVSNVVALSTDRNNNAIVFTR
ncbi:hypothetical protein [Pararhizobium mangrovi]|uniref:Uncharacterized protein n=1 Tax=Pararhizobium mangrovi TaxID=2590452 RepID=A0A506TXA8_9HYPH|nr:hypothetical protein [Pararhizobium mangrovi]TPW26693.1 hypothetical protein FJU11_13905 [Pararhizobium mangrovi]